MTAHRSWPRRPDGRAVTRRPLHAAGAGPRSTPRALWCIVTTRRAC